jgi:hypothetical protein
VARGGVEPSTFRFSVQSSLIQGRTTWHFACRGCVVKAPEALGGLELLDSPLDTPRWDTEAIPSIPHAVLSVPFALQVTDWHDTNIIFADEHTGIGILSLSRRDRP